MDDPMTRCVGTVKSTGKQCRLNAIPGGTVCKRHGGAAPQVIRAAKQRVTEQKMRALVNTYGLPVVTTDLDALTTELARSNGAVHYLEAKIQSLDEEALVWGKSQEVQRMSGVFPGTDTTFSAAVNVWLDLYLRERKHLFEVARDMAKLDIEARRTAVLTAQATVLAAALRQVIVAVGADPASDAAVRAVQAVMSDLAAA